MKHQIAQLRHAYTHLKSGRVIKQELFADGLLAPVIRELEKLDANNDARVTAQPEAKDANPS